MVATLQHNPAPVTQNFYEKSFQQLSDIQQRQTGLLVGAAVADAAAHALDGHTAEEIATIVAQAGPLHGDDEDPIVFARVNSPGRQPGGLRHHSYTYHLFSQLLRVMAAARGDFPVQYVKDEWVSAATSYPGCFTREHASLLHVAGVVLPLPVIYPWADDATLRGYARDFITFLTEPPPQHEAASRKEVHAYVDSMLGVTLRYLQSNPDPCKNAAFMAVPGTCDIFPENVALFCPPTLTDSQHGATADNTDGSRSVPPFPARPLSTDVCTVRECLTVVQSARTYAEGVKASIRLGGPVSQRSLIVGALLGARMGVRRIPIRWLSATPDHVSLVTYALQIAQWSWNPPHH
uniref:Uncharacterized protein TCIL3000_11_12540 n=1 Tax=Trypanosoma congolense (strain IL3000) TaxID=1068625 RepID=G0V286_TRYCI|nr:unnamed protein product [Trypanosoma congolense IL3000]